MDERCGSDLYEYYSTVEDELYAPYTTKMCQLTFLNIDSYLPNSLRNNIKKIIPVYGLGCYFIDNSNKIYVACCQTLLGEGSNGDIPKYGIVEFSNTQSNLNDYGKIVDIKCDNSINYMPLLFTSDTAYSIYYNTLIYRDKELQTSWKKVNEENVKVKKFDSLGNDSNSAFIDTNGNLWVAGVNPSAMGIKDTDVIKNFIIHPDDKIKGKVKDFCISDKYLFVLTNDGNLYSTGTGSFNGFVTTNINTDTAIVEELTLLKDEVKSIYTDHKTVLWVIDNNNVYFLGYNWYYVAPMESYIKYVTQLTEVLLPDGYSIDNVVKIQQVATNCSALVVEKNEERHIFIAGSGSETQANIGENGLGVFAKVWTELILDGLSSNEKIYDIELYSEKTNGRMMGSGGYILTNKGNVYGWNYEDLLGVGSTLHENTKTPISCEVDNVNQIACGNGWIVLVKKDGTVYGTGSNKYGVLGRWIGVDRSTPNSRYKTAFDWVECPELEI